MNQEKTSRGFGLYKFLDSEGEECSLQKSSIIAKDDYIWFGHPKVKIKGFKLAESENSASTWITITEKEIVEKFGVWDVVPNTKVLLSRKQVKELIPILQNFVDTGEI